MLQLKPVKAIKSEQMVNASKKNQPFVVKNWFDSSVCQLDDPCWDELSRSVVVMPKSISTITYTTHFLRKNGYHHHLTFKEVFDRIQNSAAYLPLVEQNELYYIFGGHVPKQLLSRFPWPKKLRFTQSASFVASDGLKVKSHIDYQWIYLVQLHGSKKVKLFPPTDYKYIYPYTKEPVARPRRSLVDLDKPDFNAYPLLKKCHGQVVTLQPGDVLYIPNCWFHEMDVNGFSVGFNYRVKKNVLQYLWIFAFYTTQMLIARLFYQVKPLDTHQIKIHCRTIWMLFKHDIRQCLNQLPGFRLHRKKTAPHT